jgi:hypothetical protein
MVTDSDNRIRLAPVSEGVHRPLWSVMISHISLRAVFASDAGECVVAGDPHQRTIRRETSGPSMERRTDLRSRRAKRKKLN